MNRLEGSTDPYDIYHIQQTAYPKVQQIISTIALLVLGCYALSFLDAWPSTTKRTLYNICIRAIPSRAVYLLQYVMIRLGRISDQKPMFHRQDFGNIQAKEEALQRMLGYSSIPAVIQRARSLSGYDRLMPTSKEMGPPGLGNWDNSCYQNSVLQGLASLPAFQHYIHRSLLLCEKFGVASNTTGALATFIDQLSDTTCHKQTIWTPKVLKSMDSWQQQDAQEYLTRVLEAIEKEAVLYTKVICRTSESGLACLTNKQALSSTERENGVRRMLQAIVCNPMDGMTAQALSCQTCGFSEGVSLTQFNCLTLNLGTGGPRAVEELLDEFTDPELIEGVECDNCTRIANRKSLGVADNAAELQEDESHDENDKSSKKVKKELRVKAKQITFGRLPQDLVIHINRSIWDDYGNQVKNSSIIDFPSRLDFSGRWCAPLETGSDNVQAMYELKCIVTHAGRHDNGHYVAYGKRDKDWYCFNDEVVTPLSEQQVLNRGNVFMLFYEAIDRLDSMTAETEVGAYEEAIAYEEITSPSTSSGSSEVYEEPTNNSLQAPVPVMRTASGGLYTTETVNGLGGPYVQAV